MKVVMGVIFCFIGILCFLSSIGDRNLNAMVGGYFLSFLFVVIGIAIFTSKGGKVKCPFCKEWGKKDATLCPHCRSDITKPN